MSDPPTQNPIPSRRWLWWVNLALGLLAVLALAGMANYFSYRHNHRALVGVYAHTLLDLFFFFLRAFAVAFVVWAFPQEEVLVWVLVWVLVQVLAWAVVFSPLLASALVYRLLCA